MKVSPFITALALIGCEETEGSLGLQKKYKILHCTTKEWQPQLNKKCLDTFQLFKRSTET